MVFVTLSFVNNFICSLVYEYNMFTQSKKKNVCRASSQYLKSCWFTKAFQSKIFFDTNKLAKFLTTLSLNKVLGIIISNVKTYFKMNTKN